MTAWCIPGVPFYAFTFAFLKAINYALLFWLPRYLDDLDLNEYVSGIAICFAISVFIGGAIFGWLSDKLKKRAILMPPALILLISFLLILNNLSNEPFWYFFVALGTGFSLGGPYNILTGPVLVDLGKHPKLKG